MSQLEFDEILDKYLAGKASPEEEKLVLRWYESFINESEIEISVQAKEALEAKIWGKLKNEIGEDQDNTSGRHKPLVYRLWFRYAAACVVLLIATAGFWTYHNAQKTNIPAKTFTHQQIPSAYKSVVNNKSSNISVKLADASVVELQPGSRLYYPANFGGATRNVYLTGNAFFNVTHDPAHPFIVHTNEKLVTEVLGTSFYILHYKNHSKVEQVEVNVVTGKVYVYKEEKTVSPNKSSSKKILLTPNQRVKFSPKNSQFVISLVDNPQPVRSDEEYVVPSPAAFTYTDAPLSKIVGDMAKTYGINIKIDNPRLNNCHFTGDISRKPLYDKLDIICQATQSSYEVRGTTIDIKGEGCN